MGRKRVTEGRRGRAISFNPPLNSDIMERIDKIADRERKTRSDIILKALEEYDKEHGKGQFQTMIPSYEEGGLQSRAQIESHIANDLIRLKREIRYRDIIKLLRSEGITGSQIPASASTIRQKLKQAGTTIMG